MAKDVPVIRARPVIRWMVRVVAEDGGLLPFPRGLLEQNGRERACDTYGDAHADRDLVQVNEKRPLDLVSARQLFVERDAAHLCNGDFEQGPWVIA